MKNNFAIALSLIVIMIVSLIATPSPAGAAYTLIDLGTLGGSGSGASAINEAGQVIGTSYLPGDTEQHAFVWENGVMTDLGTLGGSNSYPRYINEAGLVIGISDMPGDTYWHGFVWDPINRVMIDLDPSAGNNYSSAIAINEAGQIVGGSGGMNNSVFLWENGQITARLNLPAGSSFGPIDAISEDGLVVGNFPAMVWDPGTGTTTDLSALLGHDAYVNGMNGAGQVIGYYWPQDDASSYHAFFWKKGMSQPEDLGTWGGYPYSAPIAINESGEVFVVSNGHLLLWDSATGGPLTDLGTLCISCSVYALNEARQGIGGYLLADDINQRALFWENGSTTELSLGGGSSDSVAINEAGQVIGWSDLPGDTERHAFTWNKGMNQPEDLGTLGGTDSRPNAINESGWIVGDASLAGDLNYHAFLAILETNQPPTVSANGPYEVVEGGSVQVSAIGNDPENEALEYAWDLDHNGTFEASGQTVTFSAAGLTAPGTHTIAVQVTDSGGLTATDPTTVTVTFNTPAGNNITVSPRSEITLAFASVSSAGSTTVAISGTGPALPSGFVLGNPPTFYDIATTAVYSPPVTVCIHYDPGQYSSTDSLRLLHYENGGWVDATSSHDTTNHVICGTVSSLSPFVVAQSGYNFSGFFQPVDNLPTLNVIKAGQAVAVRFSLNGNQGLNIMAPGYPLSQRIDCGSNASLDEVEQTLTAGSSSLSYDPATNSYSYIWKTNKAWSGTCRQLIVKLSDGTEHRANFKFK